MTKAQIQEMRLFREPINRCWKSGKPGYDKKLAETAKNHRYKTDHVKLRIYPCPHCNLWHLTSRV